jgi:hypothetical protein
MSPAELNSNYIFTGYGKYDCVFCITKDKQLLSFKNKNNGKSLLLCEKCAKVLVPKDMAPYINFVEQCPAKWGLRANFYRDAYNLWNYIGSTSYRFLRKNPDTIVNMMKYMFKCEGIPKQSLIGFLIDNIKYIRNNIMKDDEAFLLEPMLPIVPLFCKKVLTDDEKNFILLKDFVNRNRIINVCADCVRELCESSCFNPMVIFTQSNSLRSSPKSYEHDMTNVLNAFKRYTVKNIKKIYDIKSKMYKYLTEKSPTTKYQDFVYSWIGKCIYD